jgi:hypothetical protein
MNSFLINIRLKYISVEPPHKRRLLFDSREAFLQLNFIEARLHLDPPQL